MQYLDPSQIVFLDAKDRNEALKILIENLSFRKIIDHPEQFYEAVLLREKIVSTGIGMGVAIPHAKLSTFQDFFLTIGIQKIEGLEWDALDKAPVRLIFLIGGPEDKQTDYLQILSCLTQFIREPSIRKKLFSASTAEEVLKILQNS